MLITASYTMIITDLLRFAMDFICVRFLRHTGNISSLSSLLLIVVAKVRHYVWRLHAVYNPLIWHHHHQRARLAERILMAQLIVFRKELSQSLANATR